MSETKDTVFIRHIKPQNFLSFGPDNEGLELRPLNILIGPNGCGKSNLIEAISFMRAAPKDLQEVTSSGGGVSEWIWKGAPKELATMKLTTVADVMHTITFGAVRERFYIGNEIFTKGKDIIFSHDGFSFRKEDGSLQTLPNEYEIERSFLGQIDLLHIPIKWISHTRILKNKYQKIRVYREWNLNRNSSFREPQKADTRNDYLAEDFSNLGLYLSRLKARFPAANKAILGGLQDIYDGLTGFEILTQGGTVQLFLTEGNFSIPATRLSDGTLHYICLLAILYDPEPPPLICIEEPELGLHPDLIVKVADHLKEASKRTQLIITTHSDVLVDAMTDTPDAVVVCEKKEGKTTMERLDPKKLEGWLKKYRLGQLWSSGDIGGNRW